MSKASKPRDLKRQLYESEADRKGYCPGCGYYHAAHGQHRPDCTAPEIIAARTETGQAHCTRGDHLADLYTLEWAGTQWSCRDCTTNQEPANA